MDDKLMDDKLMEKNNEQKATVDSIDPNQISFHETQTVPAVVVVKMGKHEVTIKQLALIAENMRQTLLELGLEISIDEQTLNPLNNSTTTSVAH
jgi:hypothetical protein